MPVMLVYYYELNATWTPRGKTINTPAKLIISGWGEGRIVVLLAGASAKGCAGAEASFIGYETPSRTYDLYVGSGDEPPVPNRDHAQAELIQDGREDFLHLKTGLTLQTPGKGGQTCTWQISSDTALEFKN